MGGANAGAITAALFLEEFVDGIPWAHIDIAGTAQTDVDDGVADRGLHRLRRPAAGRARARLPRPAADRQPHPT